MKCSSCGSSLAAFDKFCTDCGVPVEFENVRALQKFCTSCGEHLGTKTNFCTGCGLKFENQVDSELETDAVAPSNLSGFESKKLPPALVPSTLIKKSEPESKKSIRNPSSLQEVKHPEVAINLGAPTTETAKPVKVSEAPPKNTFTATNQTPSSQQPTSSSSIRIWGILAAIILIGGGGFYLGSNKQETPAAPQRVAAEPRQTNSAASPPDVAPIQQPDTTSAVDSTTQTVTPITGAENKGAAPQFEKVAEPANQIPNKVASTSLDLLNFATTRNWQGFQTAMANIMEQPKPATGNRKIARPLNDQAITLSVSEIPKSLSLLRQAHDADPSDAEIADNLGMVLRLSRNYDESEAQLMKVIGIWPNRQTAWANLAQTLSLKNKRREAIGAYIASYKVSKNKEKVLEVYKRIVDDPLDREDQQMRKDLKAVLDIIQSSSN
jgi:hypothetical protein